MKSIICAGEKLAILVKRYKKSTIIAFILLFIFNYSAIGAPLKEKDKKEILNKAYTLRIPFIENKGQIKDEGVRYYAKTFGGTLFITKDGKLVYSLPKFEEKEKVKGWVIRESLVGASISNVKGEEKAVTKVSYFRGKNPSNWKRNISTYNLVSLGEVYKGIELKVKAYGKNVEKLFYIKAGADPGSIKIKIEGARSLKVNEAGELEVETGLGVIKFTKPVAYQEINGKRVKVAASYTILSDSKHVYGFEVGSYNKKQTLIIDPLLASTFIGGSYNDMLRSTALDQDGNVYITGWTWFYDYPTTSGAYDESFNGDYFDCDAFISKLDSNLSNLLASTFIGGSGVDGGKSIALDRDGNVYITGYTYSSDYPTTSGAYDKSFNGYCDVFVSKLDSDLSAGAPPTITSISQYQSDGTGIPEGGIIPEGTIVFKATLEDPDGDDVRLEIELRKIDEPFTGEPTSETISDFVPSGSEVTITRSGLVDGDYHWQYRVKDSKGTVSKWKEFGETGNVDFKTTSLLSRYAPVFYLYFDDFRPRSIESMLDNADLWKWNNVVDVLIDNCANLLMLGPVEANQLLKHNHGNCFLDLWWAQNENVCGGTVTPNVGSFWEKYKNVVYGRYYEPSDYHSNVVLQYWFFYVYNNWHDYGGLNNHEGDWEMVQVILDKKTKEPTYVTYSHHVLNDHTTLEWKNVSKVGTHPEVFVARGSHASYPSPGVHCILGETKIGNKIISLCDILKDKYRRKLQDQTTGVETILYPERDYKIICLNNYSWPSWEGRWGKRVKELKNGNCLRSGKCGPLSPGKQKRKWNHPLEWALFSIPRIVAVVASPVHLHVYDQRGNHVGLTPEGLIEADIPETLAYYPLGDEGKLVAISTAEPLTYKIKGYEKGTFDFVLYKFLEENKVVMVSYEEVPVDENTTAILNSTSDNPNFLMDIDINNDGEADYQLRPDSVTGVTGDLDHDGDIDRNDLNIILSYRNQEAGQCPECDLDNDGVITVLDARKLVLMCTRPRCEAEVIE